MHIILAWNKQSQTATQGCRSWKFLNPIYINDKPLVMELDTVTEGNFLFTEVWKSIGKLNLWKSQCKYQLASKHTLLVMAAFTPEARHGDSGTLVKMHFVVSEIPDLNLLGWDTIKALRISLDKLLYTRPSTGNADHTLLVVCNHLRTGLRLQQACLKLCKNHTRVFQPRARMPLWLWVGNKFQARHKASFLQTRQNKDPHWVLAIMVKICRSLSVHVRVIPKGPVWRCHIDQLQPKYATIEDKEQISFKLGKLTFDMKVCCNFNWERDCV